MSLQAELDSKSFEGNNRASTSYENPGCVSLRKKLLKVNWKKHVKRSASEFNWSFEKSELEILYKFLISSEPKILIWINSIFGDVHRFKHRSKIWSYFSCEECSFKTACHEAGHVVSYWFTDGPKEVRCATIVPDRKFSGRVHYHALDSNYVYTNSDWFSEMCLYMGGILAENMLASSRISSLQRYDLDFVVLSKLTYSLAKLTLEESGEKEPEELMLYFLIKCYDVTKHILFSHKRELKGLSYALFAEKDLGYSDIHEILGSRPQLEKSLYEEFVQDQISGARFKEEKTFYFKHQNLKEALEIHKSVAEKLQSPLCDQPFCNSKGCVAMASRLQDLMLPEADPCVDFYAFSCGGYTKSKGFFNSRHSHTPAEEAAANLFIDIRKVMESPSKNNESQALGKLKQFYNSCVNTGQREADRIHSLRDWFSEINLSLEEPYETTWKSLSARLEEFGIHTILTPSFKGSANIPIEIIDVDCSVPMLQPDVYLNPTKGANAYTLSLYKELIAEVMEFLPDLDANKKNDFADIVLQMESDISRVIQAFESKKNLYSEENIQHVKELWSSVIGDSIQDVQVISSCKYNLESVLSVLDNATPKASTTYVAWKLLLQILPHIKGKGFRDMYHRLDLPSWDNEQLFEWQECAHQLQEETGLLTFRALLDAGYIQADEIQKVKESFKETKRNFLLTFRSIDWTGALIKKLFLSKVKNMKLNIGYPEFLNQPELIDAVFMNLEIGDNYFQNVLNIKKHKTRHFFNRLWYGTPKNPTSEVSLEINPLQNSPRYDYTKNTVYVNLGLLRSPMHLYTEDIPKYLRFGEISLLARQMSHAFDTTGCFYDGKGKKWERTWWPETLVRKYDFYTDCLRTQLLNKTSMDVIDNETLNTIVADIGSFLVPYDGLISHLSTFQNEKLLPSISLTKKQTYYVRIAQSYCKSEPSTAIEKENLIESPRFRVNTAVSNMKDFAEVFNCSPKSTLNPAVKCNLL